MNKMGGMDNVERMLKDPEFVSRMQGLLGDPALLAKAAANADEVFKKLKDEEAKK